MAMEPWLSAVKATGDPIFLPSTVRTSRPGAFRSEGDVVFARAEFAREFRHGDGTLAVRGKGDRRSNIFAIDGQDEPSRCFPIGRRRSVCPGRVRPRIPAWRWNLGCPR